MGTTNGLPLADASFTYNFYNFFHPHIGRLIQWLNTASSSDPLESLMDPISQDNLRDYFFRGLYQKVTGIHTHVTINSRPKEIDFEYDGPYANYNWELFFHIPLTVAVHLSKNQRFAEAQHWFHYIFDPTYSIPAAEPPIWYWRFLPFWKDNDPTQIDKLLELLSDLDDPNNQAQQNIIHGYQAMLNKPFQPHAVARTRHLAYQYCVVMKYLDNLIAWGDNLFQQDTVESINEATMHYVLAANILGPRPQHIPPIGATHSKTFADIKNSLGNAGMTFDPMGNAMVELEAQFPINLNSSSSGASNNGAAGPFFGIGRTLYFCIPRNEKLLGYWDTVADRLFKIRHCMNIEGIVRPLALFDPPIDPGMLVKATAAGIDIGSIVSGLSQPIGPVRSLILIQKALELCGEVKSLGGALLSALEKGEAEHLALIRQGHEIKVQQMVQEIRFLQWRSAQEATKSLLTSRATALERLHYYQRLLGLPADANAPDTLKLDQSEKPDDSPKLTEENFDDAYGAFVGQYDKQLAMQLFPNLKIVGDSSPSQQSGASGQGKLYLNASENEDLNIHTPKANEAQEAAGAQRTMAAILALIPQFPIHLEYWGIGGEIQFGGEQLSKAAAIGADIFDLAATVENHAAAYAAKTSSFERRADDWILQYNLAAHELMQIGRQILTSLIAEQITHHEYLSVAQQIANAQEIDQYMHDKFTNEDLYLWMQGEISRLYYEYYRFAFDTARRAERTMKQELMRPELDAQDFVKFNYWDGGRKGLLSGEALYLDVKRMEMAYHDNNKRELELTRHVSLRQLAPLALLSLKTTGSCIVSIPEALYDIDCPGHYMRRIKSVALSIPSVVGPYTSVNCTLSLLKSKVRISPMPKDGQYTPVSDDDDDRFAYYSGAIQSIVTSSGSNDSGMFETNLRDERFLPFEGAGAISTWKLDLPQDYPSFDYATISDVILHIRYTARQGVEPTIVKAFLASLFQDVAGSSLALLFSLRHDFPNVWSAFVNGAGTFSATINKDYFPYFTHGKTITINNMELYDGQDVTKHEVVAPPSPLATPVELSADGLTIIPLTGSGHILTSSMNDAFLVIRFTIGD